MTEVDFGCEYCRDDQNRLFGHIAQIGSDERRRMILLRCPRCGSLYENSPDGSDQTRRLTEAGAERLFPAFGTVDARAVRALLTTVGTGPAATFASHLHEELDRRDADARLQASWGTMRSDLRRIYSVRREHLANHGIDVTGLDSFLATLEVEPEDTQVGFVVVHTDTHNLISIANRGLNRLYGWAAVPVELD